MKLGFAEFLLFFVFRSGFEGGSLSELFLN